jgi:tetratricopeptide (TPR) repeat protein
VSAASGWQGIDAIYDASLRLALLRSPIPENGPIPHITELTIALRQEFEFERGYAPVGLAYAAIRAARRSVAENPADARSYLLLGLAYNDLVRFTSERAWALRLPQLLRVRQVQASAAFNRALELNAKLRDAHLELAQLYWHPDRPQLALGCLDLAVHHLQKYLDSPDHWGGAPKGSLEYESVVAQFERLKKDLERQRRDYARESERSSVGDRAIQAERRGLGGEARDLLLKSDVSAFGTIGMELELNLLLRTGRPDTVLEWLTPEVRASIGESNAQWMYAQALAAAGEYNAANDELLLLVGSNGRLPSADLLGREIGLRVGKAVLDEAIGAQTPPQAAILAVNRSDYLGQIDGMTRAAGRSADVTVVRGLIALESGDIDRAAEALRHALSLSPQRSGGGQLEFKSRPIARQCLSLIEHAAP